MIRKMGDDEIADIMGLWLRSTIDAHDFIEEQYWHDHYVAVQEEYLPRSTTFVFSEDDRILGFISMIDQGYVGALFVATDQQGRGIGTALIDHVRKRYDRLSLAVYKKNDRAVRFYKIAGFHIRSERVDTQTQELEYLMETDC